MDVDLDGDGDVNLAPTGKHSHPLQHSLRSIPLEHSAPASVRSEFTSSRAGQRLAAYVHVAVAVNVHVHVHVADDANVNVG
jgi:hypothetical protein